MDFDKFKNDGWVDIPGFVPKLKLNQIEAKIQLIFRARSFDELSEKIIALDKCDKKMLNQYNLCINQITEISSLFVSVDQLIAQHHPDSSGIAVNHSILLGLPADERLTYSWHQESSYMPTISKLYNIWIPLFNHSTSKNGAMSVLTGSHKLGSVEYKRIDKPNGYCDLAIDAEKFTPKYPEHSCHINPGDGILFDKDLMHRSNFNKSGKVRFSMVVRVGYINTSTQLSDWKNDY
jgi:ectoine hydroxylase-related dioxygenase (phytanoyl-CoA dioxygenase family)